MFIFPLINFTFLIILYTVHKTIFWITLCIESILYIGGIYWIYASSIHFADRTINMLLLTGMGFIIVFIAFFVAIFINHHYESRS